MKEEGRRKKEEGRRKKEEGRRKKEEGRRKRFIYVDCGPQLKTDDPYKVGVLNAQFLDNNAEKARV
ncbi:MAG: hypothetical protein KME60_05310 [Cyanomargarita calcarea GSE-NOS-MK-12-04C]|jgi:ribosomal protein S26|uniref:Uncharacterized protein n=1 Tax=Cyanomargarita calcarea GSE-NOS-MK-12-04C TaxID=2839659 RepID=A0A951QKX1_9CYAN|nr:hypothetical protein [Cyanomargarita calcarea GSE-NOS-MK-12-04C]